MGTSKAMAAAILMMAATRAIAGNSAVQIVRFEVIVLQSVSVSQAPVRLAATASGREGQTRVQLGSTARVSAELEGDAAEPVALTVRGEAGGGRAFREVGLSRGARAVAGGLALTPGGYDFGYKVPAGAPAKGLTKVVLTVTD